jgi:hypothetical protein
MGRFVALFFYSLVNLDPDPGTGIRCLFDPSIRDQGSGIKDPGRVKNQVPDPGSGSGMNIPDHISESLETSFWVKKTLLL